MPTIAPLRVKRVDITKPSRQQARFAFTVLLLINILNYADRSVLAAVLPKLQVDLQLSNTELGLLASSFLLVYAIATLPLGIWADRSPRKRIVALCVGIWSIATALAGLARNFVQLLVLRSLLGIGEAGYAPASLSMLGDYFPRAQRGRVMALWSIGNLIGTALGLILGGLIADAFGWRWAFYVIGIPGLVSALLVWRATEPVRGAFEGEEDVDSASSTTYGHGSLGKNFWLVARKLLQIPTYRILLGAFIFCFFTIGSASVWIPSYFVETFKLSVSQAGAMTGGMLAGGSLVGTLLGGWLADSLQRHRPQGRLLVATYAFLLGAPCTLVALSIHTLTPFVIVFTVAIVCLSLCVGPLNAVIQDIVTPDIRATAIGLALLLAHLFGDAASPLIIGALADQTSSLGLALLLTAPPCLLIAGLICLGGLRTVARDMKAMEKQMSHSHAAR